MPPEGQIRAFGPQIEARDRGIWLARGIVLAEGNEVNISGIHQFPDVLGAAGERIVGGDGQQHRARVAQMGLHRQRNRGIGDACGDFGQRISGAGRNN